jgi:hypothetical protein
MFVAERVTAARYPRPRIVGCAVVAGPVGCGYRGYEVRYGEMRRRGDRFS